MAKKAVLEDFGVEFKDLDMIIEVRDGAFFPYSISTGKLIPLERMSFSRREGLNKVLQIWNDRMARATIEQERVVATPTLQRAPGFRAVRIASLICTKKFVERVIEPQHADSLAEFFEALREGDKTKVWALRVAMPLRTAWAVCAGALLAALGHITKTASSKE